MDITPRNVFLYCVYAIIDDPRFSSETQQIASQQQQTQQTTNYIKAPITAEGATAFIEKHQHTSLFDNPNDVQCCKFVLQEHNDNNKCVEIAATGPYMSNGVLCFTKCSLLSNKSQLAYDNDQVLDAMVRAYTQSMISIASNYRLCGEVFGYNFKPSSATTSRAFEHIAVLERIAMVRNDDGDESRFYDKIIHNISYALEKSSHKYRGSAVGMFNKVFNILFEAEQYVPPTD